LKLNHNYIITDSIIFDEYNWPRVDVYTWGTNQKISYKDTRGREDFAEIRHRVADFSIDGGYFQS
jgi:hypothetical protein